MNMDAALTAKLLDGLERFAAAMRVETRRAGEGLNLSPTQAAVLKLLRGHERSGLRVREIARHLGVRQPTATESINALIRKGLVTRAADPTDARAVLLRATLAASDALEAPPSAAASAVEDLSETERSALLGSLIKLIRGLQTRGAIPPQRLCVTCRHFQPHRHADPAAPHHCAFVDAAFGPGALRLDCADHDPADADQQVQTWSRFESEGSPPVGGG